MTDTRRGGPVAHGPAPQITAAAKQHDRPQATPIAPAPGSSLTVPEVDVVPAEARLSDVLLAVLHTLSSAELGVALSLLHPADPYLCAARVAVDVADLTYGASRARRDVSHDVAAGLLASGMASEPVAPLRHPRTPARCDTCHQAGVPLRTVSGGWTWKDGAA